MTDTAAGSPTLPIQPIQPTSLDPADPAAWEAFRDQAHRMLDDMIGHLRTLREQPVWRPIPAALRTRWREPLPARPVPVAELHERFLAEVLPHAVGNAHPRFMGWVQGAGTPEGLLAEMLAAGLNANVGGRDQMPLEVERQVVHWMRELFDFPDTASGLLVTGSSTANLIGVLVARTRALGVDSRRDGLGVDGLRLVAYTSAAAHGCVAQAMAIAGLGSAALRRVPVDADHRIDVAALRRMLAADRAAGLQPFLVVGTAGTVDVGAIDDLDALATLCAAERLWFHVDGAFGALARLSPALAPRLAGIERADSLALDFHKWGQVPYDAGFVLVREQSAQLAAFASPAAYLARHPRGLAAGSPWPCDLGPDLSRGFRALKVWFTVMAHGRERLGAAIEANCRLARRLAERVDADARLQRLAPVALNIVCLRYVGAAPDLADGPPLDEAALDALNAELVADLHESGVAAPSTTTIGGRTAVRVALVNHRTVEADLDLLLEALHHFGRLRLRQARVSGSGLPILSDESSR